jgi:hypothetical protein
MYGVIYFTGQRIAAAQMAEIAKQEKAEVIPCHGLSLQLINRPHVCCGPLLLHLFCVFRVKLAEFRADARGQRECATHSHLQRL